MLLQTLLLQPFMPGIFLTNAQLQAKDRELAQSQQQLREKVNSVYYDCSVCCD